jgi:hypothetical protein
MVSHGPNWKWFCELILVAVLALVSGCSGIRASKSVSPLDFFLPGLLQNKTPVPNESVPDPPPIVLLAQDKSGLVSSTESFPESPFQPEKPSEIVVAMHYGAFIVPKREVELEMVSRHGAGCVARFCCGL